VPTVSDVRLMSRQQQLDRELMGCGPVVWPGNGVANAGTIEVSQLGATWLRRGYEIEERVSRFHFLVKPVENSQLRILTTLSLLNNQ
jgi:hypothetical protein